jgi:hypothetical protein
MLLYSCGTKGTTVHLTGCQGTMTTMCFMFLHYHRFVWTASSTWKSIQQHVLCWIGRYSSTYILLQYSKYHVEPTVCPPFPCVLDPTPWWFEKRQQPTRQSLSIRYRRLLLEKDNQPCSCNVIRCSSHSSGVNCPKTKNQFISWFLVGLDSSLSWNIVLHLVSKSSRLFGDRLLRSRIQWILCRNRNYLHFTTKLRWLCLQDPW